MVYITDTTTDILFPRTMAGTAPDSLSVRSQDTGKEYFFDTLSCVAFGDYWQVSTPDGLTELPQGQYDYILSLYNGEVVESGVLQIGMASGEADEYNEDLTYKQYGD